MATVWNLPNTVVGLILAFLGGARYAATFGGALLFTARPAGLWRKWFDRGWAGITVGQVIILRGEPFDPTLLRHELRHVWQQRRWGPFFFPAYGMASLVALARGKHYYRANGFEIDARKAERT